MNIKNFDRAQEVYKQIGLLDQDIAHFEKFAMVLANNETKVSFELNIKDITSEEIDSNKVSIDNDGSLQYGIMTPPGLIGIPLSDIMNMNHSTFASGSGFRGFSGLLGPMNEKKKSKHNHILNGLLPASLTLQLLAVMTGDKMILRQKYIEELTSLGVELK